MNIRDRLSSAYRYILKLPPPWKTLSLFDRQFTLREGTIRDTPDYDDAWIFACSCMAKRIFDIGANIGQSAMLELFPGNVEEVLLVDSNPLALSIAAENLIINHLTGKTRFESVFVADQPGKEVEFYTFLNGAAGSMYPGFARTASKRHLHFKVTTTTIDDLCDIYGVPDFVKIDIEGAETLALIGARECMMHHQTRFLVEMHSGVELPMIDNAGKVLEICKDVGYKAWYLARSKLLENSSQVADRSRCHLLLQPTSWPWLEAIIRIPQYAPLDKALYDTLITSISNVSL